jgi:hypothetical protein
MKRKIRKFRGGGMDAGKGSGFGGSKSGGGQGRDRDFQQRGMSKADYTKSTTQSGGGNKNVTTTQTTTQTKNQFKTRDVPFSKPFGYKSQIAASLVGLGPITTIGNFAAKQNYKGRQKFATKEGLARDFYRTTNTALQPNSPIGKDYLKDAGFGKSKAPVSTVGGGGDGNNKPILPLPIETTKSVDMDLIKPKENFFNFVAYKVGGLSGGVRYGPPPKRGPNPNVPPVKMKKGGYKK